MPNWSPLQYHTPHKRFLLLISLIGGLLGMVAPQTVSLAITHSFPQYIQVVWYFLLASSSSAVLLGMWRGGIDGMLIERAAMWAHGPLLLGWGIAVLGYFGTGGGIGTGMFFIGFGLADLSRARHLNRELDKVRAAIRDPEAHGFGVPPYD